jgi:gamma-glutamyl:cysteine ligase YbdK (ATP-grasp superfamily)
VRAADQPTDVERSAALAALLQALVAAAPRAEAHLDRDEYLERRTAAAGGEAPTEELLALVAPEAERLGSSGLLERLREPPEALRQLGLGRREGLVPVVRDVVSRSR